MCVNKWFACLGGSDKEADEEGEKTEDTEEDEEGGTEEGEEEEEGEAMESQEEGEAKEGEVMMLLTLSIWSSLGKCKSVMLRVSSAEM